MDPISRIDPKTNQLYFREINAVQLAQTTDYESVLYLLVNGTLPTNGQRKKLIHRMIKLRDLYTEDILTLEILISKLPQFREDHGLSKHDTLLSFVTLCPMVIASQTARSLKQEMVEHDSELDHVANFLWMIRGISQMEVEVRDLQISLILPMDDPDNPSLSALTQEMKNRDIIAALHAALKEHVGPLHHGAGTLAMAMFDEIQKPENVRENLEERLKTGGKIYGLGHRIYTGIDPRAIILRELLERRTMKTCDEWLLHVSEAVAREGNILLSKEKGIEVYPNIDLYNAAVYFTFGFPPELNTSLFALSRSAGWMAHILNHFKSQ
ncbi:MAG: citrate/2-methylcitrate synthase [Candidatus Thorarchaeota archaeon]